MYPWFVLGMPVVILALIGAAYWQLRLYLRETYGAPAWCQCFGCADTCDCNVCNRARTAELWYRQTQECQCDPCQSAPLDKPNHCLHDLAEERQQLARERVIMLEERVGDIHRNP